MLVGAFEHKGTRVRQQSCVQASGNFGGYFHSRFTCQPINHFAGSHGLGIDPIHMRERATAQVMIDADQEFPLQSIQPGTLNAVAFQDDGRFVVAINTIGLDDFFGKRKQLVNARHGIAQHDLGLFAQATQNLPAGERRADCVTVWTRVRSQHKAPALLDIS